MRRILGLLMLLIGLVGILLSVAGMIVGRRAIDGATAALNENLTLTLDSLDTVYESLLLTRATVAEINAGLDTVETTAADVALALDNTRPLMSQIAVVTSEEVPESLETLQASIPALLEVATAIDETLLVLSNFRIDQSILGVPIRWDLGVNYDPEVPFATSVDELGGSLEGLPTQLRALEAEIEVTDQNMEIISEDVVEIADSVRALNENVAELDPLLDEYLVTITEFSDSLRQTRATVAEQATGAKTALVVVMAWLGLTQIAPLYLGWELLAGRR